MNHLQCNFLGS